MPYLDLLLRSIIHRDLGFVRLGDIEVIAIEVDGNASRVGLGIGPSPHRLQKAIVPRHG